MYKIILADNQGVFRTGMAKVLGHEEDFRIVAQCPDVMRLQNALGSFPGATILFGSTMKQDPGPLMAQIRSLGSRGIAILENQESNEAYREAHVHGSCFRSVTGRILVDCVRRVSRGEIALDMPEGSSRQTPLEDDLVGARVRDQLTAKELKIVALIMVGLKNKEIAFRLSTTEQVIKNYLRGVYDKTGVSDRLELALFALHHRVLAEAARAAGKLIIRAA